MFYPILRRKFILDFKIEEGIVTHKWFSQPLIAMLMKCFCKILRLEFNLLLLLFV